MGLRCALAKDEQIVVGADRRDAPSNRVFSLMRVRLGDPHLLRFALSFHKKGCAFFCKWLIISG